MAILETPIAQSSPSGTTPVSIYSPGSGTITTITFINVCNTSSSSNAKFRIFIDNTGTTYNNTTAHFWDVTLKPGQTFEKQVLYVINNSSGNLAVRTDTANILTFNIYGIERS